MLGRNLSRVRGENGYSSRCWTSIFVRMRRGVFSASFRAGVNGARCIYFLEGGGGRREKSPRDDESPRESPALKNREERVPRTLRRLCSARQRRAFAPLVVPALWTVVGGREGGRDTPSSSSSSSSASVDPRRFVAHDLRNAVATLRFRAEPGRLAIAGSTLGAA